MKDKQILEQCVQISRKSTCKKMHFGCIIVKDGEIISSGWNQPVPSTCKECMRIKLDISSGTRLELCKAIHAEQMAILNAMKKGISVVGADLYVTGEYPDKTRYRKKHEGFYCTFCSRIIYYSGIRNVIVDTVKGPKKYNPERALRDSFDIAFGRVRVKK